MKKALFAICIVIVLSMLGACSDSSSTKGQTVEPYADTLSEGIDFTRPGYPVFVAETQGISGHESWGRWTEGDRAVIKFRDNLPRSFVLELLVKRAFGPNAEAPIRLRVGNKEMIFLIMQKNETFLLDFSLDQDVNTIEILIPKPTSPLSMRESNDARLLGIGLVRLRVLTK